MQYIDAFLPSAGWSNSEGGDDGVQMVTGAVALHADPDGAHESAAQVREETIAFIVERTDRVDNGRRLQLELSSLILLVLVIAQLVGIDAIVTEEVDGTIIICIIISLYVYTRAQDGDVDRLCVLGGGDHGPGAIGAIEG